MNPEFSGGPNYDINDEGNKPKHTLDNPNFFAKNRVILGNIITRNMKTTGGGDIDWLIEHNDHFTILEVKEFHDHMLVFTKGQMISFEKLYLKLEKCLFLIVGHDGIDFKDPKDKVWILDIKDWLKSVKGKTSLNQHKKYVINKSLMKEIDVKILRDILDAYWTG
jgi:hypothetical protein